MAGTSGIEEHMEVIGADGVHVGTVDRVEGDRIKLTRQDSGQGSHRGHHHYLPAGLVADVEGGKVRLSATAANALMFQEEADAGSASLVTGGAPPSAGSSGGNAYQAPDSGTTTSSASYQARGSTGRSDRKGPSKPGSRTNWTGIALGTAAAAAATAGAAFYARRQKSDKADAREFELRLQTDETLRLISSAKVEGTPVVGRDGQRLGKIDSFMVDKYTGRVAYAVLSLGGTLSMGEELFPLPWSALDYDVEKDGYALNLTAEQLERAPKFKRSDTPEFSPQYRRTVALFYA